VEFLNDSLRGIAIAIETIESAGAPQFEMLPRLINLGKEIVYEVTTNGVVINTSSLKNL
jgi:hypothetical protein